MSPKKRGQIILTALVELGGEATTRQIAAKVGLHVNGVSQTLNTLHEQVEMLDGHAGDLRWKVRTQKTA